MSTNKGFSASLLASAGILALLIAAGQPLFAVVAVGQTASPGARIDGVQMPSGTTLLAPTLVATESRPAVLHFINGEVLTLAEHSSALVESVDRGLQVVVRSGNAAYTDATGAVASLSETESVLLTQEGQIQQGARIGEEQEEEERLCELEDWTPELWQTCRYDDPSDEDCDWELIKVPMSEVPKYLEVTALLACEDRNELDLECDCAEEIIFAWWKAGAGVGAAAGAIVLYEEVIDEDDEEPASPSTP